MSSPRRVNPDSRDVPSLPAVGSCQPVVHQTSNHAQTSSDEMISVPRNFSELCFRTMSPKSEVFWIDAASECKCRQIVHVGFPRAIFNSRAVLTWILHAFEVVAACEIAKVPV